MKKNDNAAAVDLVALSAEVERLNLEIRLTVKKLGKRLAFMGLAFVILTAFVVFSTGYNLWKAKNNFDKELTLFNKTLAADETEFRLQGESSLSQLEHDASTKVASELASSEKQMSTNLKAITFDAINSINEQLHDYTNRLTESLFEAEDEQFSTTSNLMLNMLKANSRALNLCLEGSLRYEEVRAQLTNDIKLQSTNEIYDLACVVSCFASAANTFAVEDDEFDLAKCLDQLEIGFPRLYQGEGAKFPLLNSRIEKVKNIGGQIDKLISVLTNAPLKANFGEKARALDGRNKKYKELIISEEAKNP